MPHDDLGLELMRLYHDLRNATDPGSKEEIRRRIDVTLDRAARNSRAGRGCAED